MRTRLLLLSLLGASACSGGGDGGSATGTGDTGPGGAGDDDDASPPEGQCGEVQTFDLTIRGSVTKADGSPAIGARVYVEDRAWAPSDTILGEGTADGEGNFTFAVPGVTSVEDCWATLLDYWIVGEVGAETGERGVNTDLYDAITDGTLAAQLYFPLELEAP